MSDDAPTLDQVRRMVEVRAERLRAGDPRQAAQLWEAISRVRRVPGTTLEEAAPLLSPDTDAGLLREGHLIVALLELAERDFPLQARALEARVEEILSGGSGAA
jgi:hypothetical protein